MIIFVVNCGSSSIKYQLFDMRQESTLAKGMLERIGTGQAVLHRSAGPDTASRPAAASDHTAGMKLILQALVDPAGGALERIDQIEGVGHRVVHGAEDIAASVRIDEGVLRVIRRNAELAPLHNPANLAGIEAARIALPDVPHVAVFDTAFLAALPPRAFRYAVPADWYVRHHVRRYGFHGTSHRYVALRAAELLHRPADQVNLITLHLGNGCSVTAIAGGKAVDHSMGMTPLEGLVMGTRCGNIDPAAILYMIGRGLSPAEVDRTLNERSGLLGLSEVSNDMRDVLAAVERGHAQAQLALDVFVYRIVKYVGAYYAILPGLDAIVMTGGIGENAVPVRQRICQGLARLGVRLDDRRNAETVAGRHGPITPAGSSPPVWVIPTHEELMIARDTARIVSGQPAG